MWPIQTKLESSVFGEEGSNCDAAVVDFKINQQCSMCAMPVEVCEFIYRKSLVWKEITIKAIWCGWHALLESECKHLCQCVDVDGYKKLNRYPGVGNIERSKISLPSDSTCRCQQWLPFLHSLSQQHTRGSVWQITHPRDRMGSQPV